MLDLHKFMIAIARVSVNHDGRGGTAPDHFVWDQGSGPKVRKLDIGVNVDLASFPALLASWVGPGSRFKVVPFLVLILLPGRTVLSLLFFGVPYTGLWVLMTLVILGVLFWSF